MREPLRRHLVLLALAAAVLALAGTGVAAAQPADEDATRTAPQQRAEQPSLDPLLDRFPIGTGRVSTADQSPSAQGSTDAESEGSGASGLLWAILAVWAAVAVFLTVFGVRALSRRRKRRPGAASSRTSKPARARQTSKPATGRSTRVTEPSKERNVQQPANQATKGREQTAGARPQQASERGHQGPYDEVGTGVVGILEAAELAADQIRAKAVEAAAGIRRTAEQEAKARLATAEQEAAKLRADAEVSAKEAQSAAEAGLESRRKEADARAQRILAEAESQAVAVREAAAESVRQVQISAHEREKELRARVQPLEEDLRRALETFRGITGQLEELLADVPGSADASLVGDLNESARAAEARVESAATG